MLFTEGINNIKFDCFNDILNELDDNEKIEFNGLMGKEHYKLLAYYSTLFNNSIILDIGTHKGKSALALSYNKSNTVISFDIIDCVDNRKIKNKENIQYYLENLWDNDIKTKWTETILNSPFIFLDVDPHNGVMEYEFYLFLKTINYKGIMICDDIWYFKEMRDNFWYKIPDYYKTDITQYGHWSGTGIINFTHKSTYKSPRDNWTLITAYFDLTKTPDATSDIKSRDQDYYLNKYGNST
jgi:predicted O-methyltransferase YrrM